MRFGRVLDFMGVLWSVNHALDSLSKRMNTTFGVTGPQRLVLRLAGELPGVSAGRLAQVLRVHPSTLTGVLRRLVERELVTRAADPADRRRALFTLTPRGRAIDQLRTGTVEAAISKAVRRFDAVDLRHAERVLIAVVRALDAETRFR